MDQVVDVCFDAVLHSGRREAVGGDGYAGSGGFLYGDGECFCRVLGQARIGGGCKHAAGGHDLYGISALADLVTYRLGDLIGGVGLCAEEPAVSGGDGDRGAGNEQSRTRYCAFFDSLLDRKCHFIARPNVAYGGRAGQYRFAHGRNRPHREPLDIVLFRQRQSLRILGRAAVHVAVSVYQSWNQRDIAEPQHLGRLLNIGGQTRCMQNVRDLVVDDLYGAVR